MRGLNVNRSISSVDGVAFGTSTQRWERKREGYEEDTMAFLIQESNMRRPRWPYGVSCEMCAAVVASAANTCSSVATEVVWTHFFFRFVFIFGSGTLAFRLFYAVASDCMRRLVIQVSYYKQKILREEYIFLYIFLSVNFDSIRNLYWLFFQYGTHSRDANKNNNNKHKYFRWSSTNQIRHYCRL